MYLALLLFSFFFYLSVLVLVLAGGRGYWIVPYLNLLKQRNRALRFGHWIRSLQRSTQFPRNNISSFPKNNTLHRLPIGVEMLYYYYFLSLIHQEYSLTGIKFPEGNKTTLYYEYYDASVQSSAKFYSIVDSFSRQQNKINKTARILHQYCHTGMQHGKDGSWNQIQIPRQYRAPFPNHRPRHPPKIYSERIRLAFKIFLAIIVLFGWKGQHYEMIIYDTSITKALVNSEHREEKLFCSIRSNKWFFLKYIYFIGLFVS